MIYHDAESIGCYQQYMTTRDMQWPVIYHQTDTRVRMNVNITTYTGQGVHSDNKTLFIHSYMHGLWMTMTLWTKRV